MKKFRIGTEDLKSILTGNLNRIILGLKMITKGVLHKMAIIYSKPQTQVRKLKTAIEQPDRPAYIISSLLLYDCYKVLFNNNPKGQVESMCYLTGVPVGNNLVLTKIMQPTFAHQSIGGVSAEDDSSHLIFLMLDKYGHGLHAWFHTHPGLGRYATLPSSIDHNTDKRLKRGGYFTIGGIFSRDGFVRFFGSKNIKIKVLGKGVKKINDYVFVLEEIKEIQD